MTFSKVFPAPQIQQTEVNEKAKWLSLREKQNGKIDLNTLRADIITFHYETSSYTNINTAIEVSCKKN